MHPENAETFGTIAADSVASTHAKDGCLYYTFAEDVREPGVSRVAEVWHYRQALDTHLASPDFEETLQQAGELNITDRKVMTCTASNGKSLW